MIKTTLTILMVLSIMTSTQAQDMDFRQIEFNTISGEKQSLSDYVGKVVLVVNTASNCGFTSQYAGLQSLYEKYEKQGFVVLGFPANNFMGQEPGTDEEIQNFCTTNYGVTFPMMSKISVKGKDQHPLYKYLTEESSVSGKITWNFNKFLLDKEGNVVARFGTREKPLSSKITEEIEKLLLM